VAAEEPATKSMAARARQTNVRISSKTSATNHRQSFDGFYEASALRPGNLYDLEFIDSRQRKRIKVVEVVRRGGTSKLRMLRQKPNTEMNTPGRAIRINRLAKQQP